MSQPWTALRSLSSCRQNGIIMCGSSISHPCTSSLPMQRNGVYKRSFCEQRGSIPCRLTTLRNHFDPSQSQDPPTITLAFAEKFSPLRQANLSFRWHCSRLRRRLREERGKFRRQPRFAIAMDKMEITKEQILEEKQRIEEEERFLGKEELPEVPEASPNEDGPKVGAVAPEFLEVWDLWQRIGFPVEKIAKQRHMTETGVFYCIFTCIQNNYTVDWYELCKEAQFTLEIANSMIQATEKLMARTDNAPIDSRTLRQHLPDDVSDIHFGLFATMLVRGFSVETVREVSFQLGGDKPDMEWGEEYADEERFPADVSERNLLQWFAEKNGASMIEIALKFRECDDLQLMRLLLKLEKEGKIFWKQGIFRVI